jgi:hypothetical protein
MDCGAIAAPQIPGNGKAGHWLNDGLLKASRPRLISFFSKADEAKPTIDSIERLRAGLEPRLLGRYHMAYNHGPKPSALWAACIVQKRKRKTKSHCFSFSDVARPWAQEIGWVNTRAIFIRNDDQGPPQRPLAPSQTATHIPQPSIAACPCYWPGPDG